MEAAAGLELPPEFDVLRTPHSGHTVSTTVWFALPDVPQPAPGPPMSARPPWPMPLWPPIWSSACRPSGGAGRSSARRGSQVVTLADLGLSVADTLAYSQDGLRQLAIEHANGQSVIDRSVNGDPSSPGLRAHREVGRVAMLCRGHVRDAAWTPKKSCASVWSPDRRRPAAVGGAGRSDADAIALRRARRWGIAPSPLDDALAPEEYRRRRSNSEKISERVPRTASTDGLPHDGQRALRGPGPSGGSGCGRAGRDKHARLRPLPSRCPRRLSGERRDSGLAGDCRWRETSHGPGGGASARQRTPWNVWSNQADPWAFEGGGGRFREEADNVTVVYSPAPAYQRRWPWGTGWLERTRAGQGARRRGGLRIQRPSSRAPQAILLAVTPDEATPLDTETLAHIVLETRELAHARAATAEDLERLAALFPFSMLPRARPPA